MRILTIQRKDEARAMTESHQQTIPLWFWVIAVIAVFWNLMGCAFFGMEVFAQEAMMESMTEAQKEWARSIPRWVYVAYGLAVVTGVAGSVGLLMRKDWTTAAFGLCFVSVVVQMVYTMLIAGGLQAMGPSGLIMPTLVIVLAGVFLWSSWFGKRQRWWKSQPTPR